MTLYHVALIAAIPTLLSFILFLATWVGHWIYTWRSKATRLEALATISVQQAQSNTRIAPSPPARTIMPIPIHTPAQSTTKRQQRKINRAIQRFMDGQLVNAIKIVKDSLKKSDTRWQVLCHELRSAALPLTLKDARRSLVQAAKSLLGQSTKLDLESASQILVFGTWYLAVTKEQSSDSAKIWKKMGDTFSSLPRLLHKPHADYRDAAIDCYYHALKLYRGMSDTKGQALTLYAMGKMLIDDMASLPNNIVALQSAISNFEQASTFYDYGKDVSMDIWADLYHALGDAYFALYRAKRQEVYLAKAQEAYLKLQTMDPQALTPDSLPTVQRKLQDVHSEFLKMQGTT
jgi:tetratricopeptide (TPR) repeat protein